jgi:hypothetical protein
MCHKGIRNMLVESIIDSQPIFYLTSLRIPSGSIKFINKIERAFLWFAKYKTTWEKCMVNWETV